MIGWLGWMWLSSWDFGLVGLWLAEELVGCGWVVSFLAADFGDIGRHGEVRGKHGWLWLKVVSNMCICFECIKHSPK